LTCARPHVCKCGQLLIIITFANSKGGVGKSTSCVALAGAYAKAGKRVHIIDLDSNKTVSRWLSDDKTRPANLTVSVPDPQLLTEHLQETARHHAPDITLIDIAGSYERALVVNTGSAAYFAPSGKTWGAIISNMNNTSGQSGLLVENAWATNASAAFQVASNWNGSSNAFTPYFTVAGDGNVGIGTTSPSANFEINAASAGHAGEIGNFRITNSSDTSKRLYMGIDTSLGTYGSAFIQYVKNGVNYQPLLLNPNGGNVGIGTTSPAYKLDVSGIVGFDGLYSNKISNFYVDDNIGTGNPGINFDANDYIDYDRTNNAFTFASGGSTRLKIDSSGNVGIATTNPDAGLGITSGFSFLPAVAGPYLTIGHASGASAGQPCLGFSYNGTAIGSITQNGTTGTTYNTSSDRRIKENIATTTLGLDALMRLSVRDFSFRSDATHATTSGFIAQELYEIFP
jgi:AAA domain/Chaperone of endosialidase